MMKRNLLKQKTTHTETISLQQVVKPHIAIESGLTELDKLLGGFQAGEIIFIDGNSSLISDLPNQLCVHTYRTFHIDTVYIDGGMSANPYHIAKYARMMELDAREILEHVHISRAFTVYQLTTLIQDMLEPFIQKHNPLTLIIGRLPTLHLDSDITSQEAQTLMKNNVKKLKELTRKYDLVTIFTNRDKTHLSNTRNLSKILYPNVNEIVRLKQLDQCIKIELVKREKHATIMSFAHGQLRLEDFGMVT